MTGDTKAIFFDERERRWRRARGVLALAAMLATALLSIFAFAVFEGPELPAGAPAGDRAGALALFAGNNSSGAPLKWLSRDRSSGKGAPLRLGFYVADDAESLRSLQSHHRDLDVLAPTLLHATSPDGRVNAAQDPELARWLRESGAHIAVMPVVDNFDGTTWRGAEIGQMLGRDDGRRMLVAELERYAAEHHSAGILIDFEEVPPAGQAGLRQLARELAAHLHARGRRLLMALPAMDPAYDYAELGRVCDAIVLMNYDQHWERSTPGPIAAQPWFAANLTKALETIPPDKLIVGVANYAYDWMVSPASAAAESKTVPEALAAAQSSAAGLVLDPESLNPHFSYLDTSKREHRVWLLDAVTAHNQIGAADHARVLGTALWRLGSEDPTFWSLWNRSHGVDASLSALEHVPAAESPQVVGDGDVWNITHGAQAGRRQIRRDPATGTIVEERFSSYPHPARVEQQGDAPGKIALTFDDGPDPRFTPQVLQVLREKHVIATFFVTGLAAYGSPRLLERVYTEGHEIGNHTYTHTDLEEMSSSQLRLELTLTQRLIQSRLGVNTRLFRPPYGVDDQAVSPGGLERLRSVQQLGYRIVGSQIDANDWGDDEHEAPPTADEIVDTVVEQARAHDGHVVLMHDGGGDRRSTVEALPRIIDGLRAAGFELVPVSALLGETRADAMPPLAPVERWMARANAVVFDGFRILRLTIAVICLTAIVLIAVRSAAIAVLAVLHKRRRKPVPPADFALPLVSVLVPAYDEEKVIASTLESVLRSDYSRFEVIVVDDGSRDATGAIVQTTFGTDPRVRLLHQPNQGKSAALNRAVAEAQGDVLVTIDADTRIDPATIANLVRHFVDPKVAGVAGNTKVANRARRLARWQALEYISGQNLEKRAFDLLNCITVVPGAVGAWRAAVIRSNGGFSKHTVAEDTDLTLTIRRNGWRIVFDDEAVGHTIAPETSGALVRQRFRWTFGTLQALWKHRDAFGRERYGTLGRVALPHILLFQILLPLFCPLVDLLFFGSILLWALAHTHFGPFLQLWTPGDVERAMVFFGVFMLVDLLTSLVAFALERGEDWSLLLSLPLQRFYYRQLMDVVLFRAILRAIQGRAVGWGRIGPRSFSPLPHPSAG